MSKRLVKEKDLGDDSAYVKGEQAFYNKFYATGGWHYDLARERTFLEEKIIKPCHLARNAKILEIGCGRGVHSHLFYELGFDVTGIDASEVAIRDASSRFHGPIFLAMDLAKLPPASETFDLIYARGMSWFHYELNEINTDGVNVPRRTKWLFEFLRPGGIFVLQISTDFSGYGRGPGGVHFNKLDEYIRLFEPLGEIVLLSNWRGELLHSQQEAARLRGNIIIAARKIDNRRSSGPAGLKQAGKSSKVPRTLRSRSGL